jgi:Rieske Fe-S protein
MADSGSVDRRKFLKVCVGTGAAVAANPALIAQPAGELVPAERVRLVDARGETLEPGALKTGQSYVFHYPYVTTPCFLIDLGAPAEPGAELTTSEGEAYRWTGGVGRHKPMSGTGTSNDWWKRGQVIYCCSEGSVYDARDGGRVLGGPAPQPLAAVSLEYADDDKALFATGIYGGDMLESFLSKFGFQVSLSHKRDDIWQPATKTATVWPMNEYSRTGAC